MLPVWNSLTRSLTKVSIGYWTNTFHQYSAMIMNQRKNTLMSLSKVIFPLGGTQPKNWCRRFWNECIYYSLTIISTFSKYSKCGATSNENISCCKDERILEFRNFQERSMFTLQIFQHPSAMLTRILACNSDIRKSFGIETWIDSPLPINVSAGQRPLPGPPEYERINNGGISCVHERENVLHTTNSHQKMYSSNGSFMFTRFRGIIKSWLLPHSPLLINDFKFH